MRLEWGDPRRRERQVEIRQYWMLQATVRNLDLIYSTNSSMEYMVFTEENTEV